jgi:molecular chaperone DnaK
MKKHIVGIDLGTSYSSIAWVDESGEVQVLRDDTGDPLMPSAVYFHPGGSVHVGKPALAAGEGDPAGLLEETKRLMDEPDHRWKVRENEGGEMEVSPIDVAAVLLRQLREDFEARVGPIERAVITVPAHYGSFERQLVREAAAQAGLPTQHLVNEPIAASLAFILHKQDLAYLELAGDRMLLVYDLGGGTFDAGLVRYQEKKIRVVAQDNHAKLGGINWNRRLEEYVARVVWFEHGVKLTRRSHGRVWRKLETWAERTKRAFSEARPAPAAFGLRIKGQVVTVPVSLETFEGLTQDLAEETYRIVYRLVREARVDGKRVHWGAFQVLAVGGCIHMRMIKRILEKLTLSTQLVKFNVAPELAVVHGAALFARLWVGASSFATPAPAQDAGEGAAVSQVSADGPRTPAAADCDGHAGVPPAPPAVPEFIPASSRSLGIAVYRPGRGLVNRVLIPKDSPLPAVRSLDVTPRVNGQKGIDIKVLEGSDEDLGRCMMLCHCTLTRLPPNLTTKTIFTVTLQLNRSNFLEAEVTHRELGKVGEVRYEWEPAPAARPGPDAETPGQPPADALR